MSDALCENEYAVSTYHLPEPIVTHCAFSGATGEGPSGTQVFAESSSAHYLRKFSMEFVGSKGRGFAVIDGGITVTNIDLSRVTNVRTP